MNQPTNYYRRSAQVLEPHPHSRFASLKPTLINFNPRLNSIKRLSLDTRNTHPHINHSIQNAEEFAFAQESKNICSKNHLCQKNRFQDYPASIKYYYWRGNSIKQEKKKQRKIKGVWSQLAKNDGKKTKKRDVSKFKKTQPKRSKRGQLSDREQTRIQITQEKSYQTDPIKDTSQNIKLGKSVLNSTMLTKRESQSSKENPLDSMIVRLRDILTQYERKMLKLTEEKDYYRLKLKKMKRKKE